MTNNKKVCFLASGGGGTFRFLINAVEVLNLPIDIVSLIADRECLAVDCAKYYGVKTNLVKYLRNNNLQLIKLLEEYSPDLIVTNIHKIIDKEVLEKFPDKFINLHYSLLPKYAGLIGMKTVDCAKQNLDKEIGGTCHKVNEFVDAGEILSQKSFQVDWNENINKIYDRVFRISCESFLDGVVQELKINKNNINLKLLDESFWLKVKEVPLCVS